MLTTTVIVLDVRPLDPCNRLDRVLERLLGRSDRRQPPQRGPARPPKLRKLLLLLLLNRRLDHGRRARLGVRVGSRTRSDGRWRGGHWSLRRRSQHWPALVPGVGCDDPPPSGRRAPSRSRGLVADRQRREATASAANSAWAGAVTSDPTTEPTRGGALPTATTPSLRSTVTSIAAARHAKVGPVHRHPRSGLSTSTANASPRWARASTCASIRAPRHGRARAPESPRCA